jgi:signal transduction histidine kinase
MSERVNPCPGPGGCEDLTFCVCQEMRAQNEKNARLREALEQCAEYFDDRADVDTSDGEPVANNEMRLLGVVREALDGSVRG